MREQAARASDISSAARVRVLMALTEGSRRGSELAALAEPVLRGAADGEPRGELPRREKAVRLAIQRAEFA